jgi:hypothetical protein
MTHSLPQPDDDTELPKELMELGHLIAQIPSEQQGELESAYQRVVASVRRRRRILSLVQEALSELRLDVKYLMFDLEVTRRERDELQERLDS